MDNVLIEHAKYEVALLPITVEQKKDILRVIEAIAEMKSRPLSGSQFMGYIYDLLELRPLSPLTDKAEEWLEIGVDPTTGTMVWKSLRYEGAFSYDAGKTYFRGAQMARDFFESKHLSTPAQ